jgi:hypothetical protein
MRKAARRSSTLFAELFSESVLRLILTEGEKVVANACYCPLHEGDSARFCLQDGGIHGAVHGMRKTACGHVRCNPCPRPPLLKLLLTSAAVLNSDTTALGSGGEFKRGAHEVHARARRHMSRAPSFRSALEE